jgi:hypothetical protein
MARSRDEQPHRLGDISRESGICEKPRVKGGHAHHDRGAWQSLYDTLFIEALKPDRRASAEKGAVQRHEQAVNVKYR